MIHRPILWLFVLTLGLSSVACASTVRVYDTHSSTFLTHEQWIQSLPGQAQIVLGEMHYSSEVQKAEGKIIRELAQLHPQSQSSLAWEFLDFPDQSRIEDSFHRFVSQEIDETQLLKELKVGGQSQLYLPMLQAAREVGAELYGVNVSRQVKKIVIDQGFDGLKKSPHLLPPDLSSGSQAYRRRFDEAMKDHVPADKLEAYFRAQYYTDAIMAWRFSHLPAPGLRFLVVGSFHSDFNDGVADRIRRQSSQPTLTVKLLDENHFSSKKIQEMINGDPVDGAYADFLYLIK